MLEELKSDKSKYLYYFLIFAILAGIFVRFYGIDKAWLENDETFTMISGIKLNHAGNPYDPRFYLYENPPAARWITGLPTRFITADYSQALNIPVNMYVWSYLPSFNDIYVPARLVSAAFGTLSVALIFLITKTLFGWRAGIWSAASAALSFDLIFYSRITLTESMFVGLVLSATYFYIRYIRETRRLQRYYFMLLSVTFITAALGTRSLTPMLLIPIFLASQFLINQNERRAKENTVFIVLIVLGIFFFMNSIWPPDVRAMAQKLHGVSSLSDTLGFSLPEVIIVNLVRNSYIYAFSIALLAYAGFRFLYPKEKPEGYRLSLRPVISYVKSASPSLLIVIFFAVYFVSFSLLKPIYAAPRYEVILFVPIFILSGKVLEEASRNKIMRSALIFLVLVNFYIFAKVYPYYSEYQNFSGEKCTDYMILCSTTSSYNHFGALEDAMKYMKTLGNPAAMTTEFNVMVFYGGKSAALIAPYDSRCNENDAQALADEYGYIIYWGARGGSTDLRSDQYMCPYIRALPMEQIASFGNYSAAPGENPDALPVRLYKIKKIA